MKVVRCDRCSREAEIAYVIDRNHLLFCSPNRTNRTDLCEECYEKLRTVVEAFMRLELP